MFTIDTFNLGSPLGEKSGLASMAQALGITGHLPIQRRVRTAPNVPPAAEFVSGSEHFQNHLAARVACLAELMGMARFGQRQHGFDNGLEPSRIDQLCKLSELHG
jgi:hypothetical protein